MKVQHGRRLLAGALISAFAVVAAPADAAKVARPSITKVTVSSADVTVRGRVKLPVNNAAVRRRTRVLVTLEDASGKVERFKRARIGRNGSFRAGRQTALSGALILHVQVTIGGHRSGRALARRVQVSATPGGGTTPGGGSPTSGPNLGNPPIGTFKPDAGAAPSGGAPPRSRVGKPTPPPPPPAHFSSPTANTSYTPPSPR